MAEIGFYHLTKTPLERALPQLLEKIHGSGARAVVMAGSAERVDALNAMLWTYDPASFLPHGAARDGNAEVQPIWLTVEDENPNQSKFLVLTDGAASDHVSDYDRCFEMFDGHDEQALSAARTSWKTYRDAGHDLTYWQQTERGGWEQKNI
ncbi:MAG: DNA polymerase III subunit chi [Rhodospirillales bacterium]|nr:DNA polymerase III subunit chi [Rhodospirillales bacterium]